MYASYLASIMDGTLRPAGIFRTPLAGVSGCGRRVHGWGLMQPNSPHAGPMLIDEK